MSGEPRDEPGRPGIDQGGPATRHKPGQADSEYQGKQRQDDGAENEAQNGDSDAVQIIRARDRHKAGGGDKRQQSDSEPGVTGLHHPGGPLHRPNDQEQHQYEKQDYGTYCIKA